MNILREIRFRLGTARRAHELHYELDKLRAEARQARSKTQPSVKATNLIWIFGAPRSGTSWLARMLGGMPSSAVWQEPDVGRLFGTFWQQWHRKADREGFILADEHRSSYLKGLRTLVLDGARQRYVDEETGKAPSNIVIKEPNGSIGAPFLSAAFPLSRVILLIRDPRDTLSSMLEASKEGNWLYERYVHAEDDWRKAREADLNPEAHLRRRATEYVDIMSGAVKAFEDHPGPKISVRYEEMLVDPHTTLTDITNTLNIRTNQNRVNKAVERFSYQNVPSKAKGYGKAIRKAEAGGWREDLTEAQVAEIERITADFMDKFGYERAT